MKSKNARKMIFHSVISIALVASIILGENKAFAWSTDTYGTSGSGYYLYVRRTTGSTLLGIMHLVRTSIGIYNTFTAKTAFLNQVTAAVKETATSYTYYSDQNNMLPNQTLTASHVYQDHTPQSVYGFMSFVDYE